jgi:hypothetical protein
MLGRRYSRPAYLPRWDHAAARPVLDGRSRHVQQRGDLPGGQHVCCRERSAERLVTHLHRIGPLGDDTCKLIWLGLSCRGMQQN